jgi:uncharacterized membrane protein
VTALEQIVSEQTVALELLSATVQELRRDVKATATREQPAAAPQHHAAGPPSPVVTPPVSPPPVATPVVTPPAVKRPPATPPIVTPPIVKPPVPPPAVKPPGAATPVPTPPSAPAVKTPTAVRPPAIAPPIDAMAQRATPPPPPPVRPPAPPAAPAFDWESLVGVKLFSAIAGIALVLAAVFFLRYSVQQGWLQPPVRVTIGILVAVALLVLCELKAARKYAATANALDAAAIAILFSTFFAAHALWNLIPPAPTFGLLALVTALAVLLSIRRESLFIAVLGLLGGFATPALLSTGENRPLPLFATCCC